MTSREKYLHREPSHPFTGTENDQCAVDRDNFVGALIQLTHLEVIGRMDHELERIDALTPIILQKINSRLSVQQRKILSAMVKEGRPLRIREITQIARLGQQNVASSQVNRMVKNGFLEKDGKAYRISRKDPDLERFCVARWTEFPNIWRSKRSHELIPDRKNPISYFIQNRQEIIDAFYKQQEETTVEIQSS